MTHKNESGCFTSVVGHEQSANECSAGASVSFAMLLTNVMRKWGKYISAHCICVYLITDMMLLLVLRQLSNGQRRAVRRVRARLEPIWLRSVVV